MIKDIFYFSGTHWDREWYMNFQAFRYKLVSVIDEMIDYLEKEPDFKTFHFDGQTIVLEDYKEIAPENTQRLKKLIADGRIKIGPWYDMPDEFLVSGESLIRNLMFGHKYSKKWGGEPWKFGYICDIFGHIAQMPQIFNSFGIEHAILGRGASEDGKAFFIWKSPDGSECVTFKLNPEEGYGYITGIFHNTDEYAAKDILKEEFKKAIDKESERSNSSVLILMDALDHNRIHKNTPEYLSIIKELYPNANVHHCDLSEAKNYIDAEKSGFTVIAGELNKTAVNKHSYLHLITNTLSSYYTHKKQNDECQNMLEKVIEPMAALASFGKHKIRKGFIDRAYEYLLKNHPHDSICGCSIDQVHKDMIYRFDQVKEIGQAICEAFVVQNRPEKGSSLNYMLRLYNPLPFERDECVTADIVLGADFPAKYSEPFGYEDICSFKIIDLDGREIPYQRVKVIKNYSKRIFEGTIETGECYTVSFMAKIPPCGYSEYKIVPSDKPTRYLEKMTSGANFAENELIRIEINSCGEINLYDKKTGCEYKNLLSFIDDGEIGDGWYHASPVNDVVVNSYTSDTRLEKTEDGVSRCVFRITKHISVPECIENTANGYFRSSKYVTLPLTAEIGLSENAAFADVKLTVENTAKDHRLRLSIPTGVLNKKYFAGQTYYCNERKTGIDYNTQNWREHEQYEKQMNGIVGMRNDDGNGLAFVCANGLHECAAYDDGNICITLLRAFKRTVNTMGEVNGQLLGTLEYNFLLCPINNNTTYSELVKLQDRLAVKPICDCMPVSDNYTFKNKSYMELSGENLNLSIVKIPEDEEENAVIVRVYNASGIRSDGILRFGQNIAKAYNTNMNEEILSEVKPDNNILSISAEPWKVNTYKVIF